MLSAVAQRAADDGAELIDLLGTTGPQLHGVADTCRSAAPRGATHA
jgi:hypothetical protein